MPEPPILLVTAKGLFDARSAFCPGSLLLERRPAGGYRVLAVGAPADVDRHPAAARATPIDRPAHAVIPALVNAHVHLDLSHLAPEPLEGGFVGFVERVRHARAGEADAIRRTVEGGVAASLAAGVAAVGDIAGAPRGVPSLEPARVLRASRLGGVSFIEFFAIGMGEASGLERLDAAIAAAEREGLLGPGPVRVGVQPHATNTVSLAGYAHAAGVAGARGLPLSTHAGESPEEREFIARGTGPQREMLERFGLWADDLLEHLGHDRTPLTHLRPALERAPFLIAHANQAADEDIALLARTGAAVAYCPRASAYFGAERAFGPHRYLDMLAAGVPVALGTDSLAVAPTLSILDEMRELRRRDGAPPRVLLEMATTNGARALGLDERAFRFVEGAPLAGLLAVASGGPGDVLAGVMAGGSAPEVLVGAGAGATNP